MASKTTAFEEQAKPHAHWEKVVSAAYLRMIGHTQKEAAVAVGRNARTLREWESDDTLWNAARNAARDRWLTEVADAARRSVLKAASKNADLGMKLLERLDPALAPKKDEDKPASSIILNLGFGARGPIAEPKEVPGEQLTA